MRRLALTILLVLAAAGCAAQSHYEPKLAVPHELILQYDSGFQMWASGRKVTQGTGYGGLADYVRCVPVARGHAMEAEAAGSRGTVFTALGLSFGTAALGGLAGLGFLDQPDVALAFFGAGVASGVLGVVFGVLAYHAKNDANGEAIDSMNAFNDTVDAAARAGAPIPCAR